ncbi:MAG: DegQ family serine endoprotease [Desulfococcaceae bacterium]
MQRKQTVMPVIAIFLALVFAAGVPAASARTFPDNISDLAERVAPGVVNIRTVKNVADGGRVFRHFFGNPFGDENPFGRRRPFGPFGDGEPGEEFRQRSLGSGFIIDKEGFIVTNNHVVEDADEIKVRLSNGKEFDAEVVGRDPQTDLALIRIAPSNELVPLKLGDSENLRVGTWVVAMGSPFGLEQTVTAGIVSAKGRVIGAGPYDDFIQTDASINPGNSGGPLMDLEGNVVGINTAIVASGQGIGFAIPIDLARNIIEQLQDQGEVTRGWLGVGIQELTDQLREYYNLDVDQKGVLVTEVYENDPADEGGIREGDVILSVDGTDVESPRELSGMIANMPVGKEAEIVVLRQGRTRTLEATLGQRSEGDARIAGQGRKGGEEEGLGLRLTELDEETARRLGYDEDEEGVLVTGVQSGGKAAQAGIRQGDLIVEINRKPVPDIAEFKKIYESVNSGGTVNFLVRRGRGGMVVISMEK